MASTNIFPDWVNFFMNTIADNNHGTFRMPGPAVTT